MTRRPWTAPELAVLASMYPHCATADVAAWLQRSRASVYATAYARGLHKTAEFLASEAAGRVQRGQQHPRMAATQFRPGQAPWNKGQPFNPGGRSVATRFKPGNRPHTWVPIGSHRVTKDGTLQRKVTDHHHSPRDWEAVARIVWRQANGSVPPGHVVVFKPGRKTIALEHITLDALEHITLDALEHITLDALEHITLDALECISRAQLVWRNHPANKSPELAKLVQLKGAITRQVNRIAREHAGPTHHRKDIS
jgi:hypothetical protein